ncbi:MAG TPA: endo-1,4-beta-xylanase, partial [Gemmataceae bacterium]|nr:endo-1,4-beta-xylanase [Gemmataceae bacterium]
ELVRGKLHLLRSLAAEGQERGRLFLPGVLVDQIDHLTRDFTHIVHQAPSPQTEKQAQVLLERAYQAAEQLVLLRADERLGIRHQRLGPLDALMGCRLGSAALVPEQAAIVARTFNSVQLRMTWKEVEPTESNYLWDAYDAHLEWAEKQGLAVTAGPLIEFAPASLPDWLWLWERDLSSVATFMCDYVATALRRYAGRIRTWQLTAASNCGNVLALGEDEREYLTIRLMQLARKLDPNIELIIGIAQPWGEYMAQEDYTYSPVIFADTLVRSGLDLAAIDLEVTPGFWPRGSYCRDLMEVTRLFELYRSLHVPLRLTLGYPAAAMPDPEADPERALDAGHWHGGFTATVQAEWAAAVTTLALSDDAVRGIHWVHLSDAQPHQFPHSGLFDNQNRPRPILNQFLSLRQLHLR